MLLNEILIEATWKKYGRHKGVQYRVGTPEKATPAEKTKAVADIKKKVAKVPKLPKEKKPRIPRFSSAEPKNDLERLAKDAMYSVWQQIGPDVAELGLEDPYEIAEMCYDAGRLKIFAGLSDEDEKKVLKLGDRTLARLASNFGY